MDGKFTNNQADTHFLKDLGIQEEIFRIIADNTHDMERFVLPDKSLAYISPSCERITGYSRKEHLRNPGLLAEIIHPEDKATFDAIREDVFLNGIVRNMCIRIITKAGEIRWLDFVAQKVSHRSGRFIGFRTSSRDITESVQVKNDLALSEARYKAVVETQSELIVRHSPDGVVSFVNHAFARFTGVGMERLIGLRWFDVLEKDFADKIKAIMSGVTPAYPVRSIEMENSRHDGVKRWFCWTSKGIFDVEGKINEFQVVGHDITDLKSTEEKLRTALEQLEHIKRKLEEENLYLKDTYLPFKNQDGFISNAPVMAEVIAKMNQVSMTDAPVLITGETGTGKEVVAQTIHHQSKRKRRLMITVNCAALPASLIESELFGREKGAYTGALSRQIGRFELADNSTIFLDEIGELPPEIQVKLLRVLQSGEFQMLGAPETKKVNVRIIAATNRDLAKAVTEGKFRMDLYYRLNVFPIHLPPLRERKEDIPLLTWTFVDEITNKMGKQIEKISPRGMNSLLHYSWPGNIRELRNIIEFSIIMCNSTVLDFHLPQSDYETLATENMDEWQRSHIEKILQQCDWKIRGKDGAAEKLGLKESTLRFRMKKLGIQRDNRR